MQKVFRRPLVLLFLLFILPVIPVLIYPMASSDFKIEIEDAALESKSDFLRATSHNPDTRRPNIILITVDDLGMADCSLYGEGDISTPNIERLGSEGIIFENAYVTSPVCAPSRAAMITGRYQHRFGFEFTMHERYLKNRLEYLGFRYFVNSDPWVAKWTNSVPDEKAIYKQGLPLSEITLAEILYNLNQNKYENPDVAPSNPRVVNELKTAFQDWEKSHKPPMWPSVIYFTAKKDGVRYYFEQ